MELSAQSASTVEIWFMIQDYNRSKFFENLKTYTHFMELMFINVQPLIADASSWQKNRYAVLWLFLICYPINFNTLLNKEPRCRDIRRHVTPQ